MEISKHFLRFQVSLRLHFKKLTNISVFILLGLVPFARFYAQLREYHFQTQTRSTLFRTVTVIVPLLRQRIALKTPASLTSFGHSFSPLSPFSSPRE